MGEPLLQAPIERDATAGDAAASGGPTAARRIPRAVERVDEESAGALHRLPLVRDSRGSLVFAEIERDLGFSADEALIIDARAGAPAALADLADVGEAPTARARRALIALGGDCELELGDGAGSSRLRLGEPDIVLAIRATAPCRVASASRGTSLLSLAATAPVDVDGPRATGGTEESEVPVPSARPRGRVGALRTVALARKNSTLGPAWVVRTGRDMPFRIARAYYLFDVPADMRRGAHAHRELQQLFVCVRGSVDIALDDGREHTVVHLDSPATGLYVPSMLWRDLSNFSSDAICLVLASHPYSREDYLWDYETYRRLNRE